MTTFDDFVRARLPQLLRFGRALTGDDHRGADLVQDALERALPKWSRIESEYPEGYVRRIMVNRNISVWRSLRRERLTDEPPDAATTDPTPDEALFVALRSLAPRQRTVIALRYLADQTEAQTAALMGCSVGAVKSQTHAAMQRLRELLGPQEDDR
ncbi:MAG TPA: SigE family RNA polymerase sigma factor [Nocardioides sp.]|nr:SigE family RNA polymerase sigma factor [Nocardioides sp.]